MRIVHAIHINYEIDLADIGDEAQDATLQMHEDRVAAMVDAQVRQKVKDAHAIEKQKREKRGADEKDKRPKPKD